MKSELRPNSTISVQAPPDADIEPGVYSIAYKDEGANEIFLVKHVDLSPVFANGRWRCPAPSARPQPFPLSGMRELVDRALISDTDNLPPLRFNQPCKGASAAGKAIFEKWKEILSELTRPERLYNMLVNRRYEKEIEQVSQRSGMGVTEISRRLHRYFVCCGDINAASLQARGAPRPMAADRKKVGRKRLDYKKRPLEDQGSNSSELAKEAVALLMKSKRLLGAKKGKNGKTPRVPIAEHFRTYKNTYIYAPNGVSIDGKESFRINPEYAITYSQFHRIWRSHESILDEAKRLAGKRRWAKDHRILTSHAGVNDWFSGSTYVIDATIADVQLVSSIDGSLRIGRPTIYCVADIFSRCILAIHVCLDPPSAKQGLIALFRAMTGKRLLCQALGVPSDVSEFLPQGCRPTSIFTDRGELLCGQIRDVCEASGMVQAVAAAYRAEWKSVVERMFKVFNDQTIHRLPGATPGSDERGEESAALEGKLTINGLTRALLHDAAMWNATHDGSRYAPLSLHRKCAPVPMAIYQKGLELLHGSPFMYSREQAVRTFLQPIETRATRSGVRIEQVEYASQWMADSDWYQTQHRMSAKVSVYRDPDRPHHCLVAADKEQILEAEIVDRKSALSVDASIDEFEDYCGETRKLSPEAQREAERTEARIWHSKQTSLARDIDAGKAAQAGDSRSKAAKKRIKENRLAEIEYMNGKRPEIPKLAPCRLIGHEAAVADQMRTILELMNDDDISI